MNFLSKDNFLDVSVFFMHHPWLEITPTWCQATLRQGNTIDEKTTVIKVEIKPLTDENNGFEDGGGFSGSNLFRILITYG